MTIEAKFIFNTIENKNIYSYFTNEITHHSYIYPDGLTISESKKARLKRRNQEKQETLDLKFEDFILALKLSSKTFNANYLSYINLDNEEKEKGEIDFLIQTKNKKIYCEVTDTHLLSDQDIKKFRRLLSIQPLIGALEFAKKEDYSFLIPNVLKAITSKKIKITNKSKYLNEQKWLLINIMPSPLSYSYITDDEFKEQENNLKRDLFTIANLQTLITENNNFFKKIIINLKYGTINHKLIKFVQEIYLVLTFS